MDDKEIIKQAFKEWLDEQVLKFGWFSIKFFGVALLGYLLYLGVTHGIVKP